MGKPINQACLHLLELQSRVGGSGDGSKVGTGNQLVEKLQLTHGVTCDEAAKDATTTHEYTNEQHAKVDKAWASLEDLDSEPQRQRQRQHLKCRDCHGQYSLGEYCASAVAHALRSQWQRGA